MKKIAFIASGFINQTEANAICLKNIIDIMKDSIKVDVISIEQETCRCSDYSIFVIKQSNVIEKNEIMRKIIKFFHMPVGSRRLSKLVARRVCSLLKERKYDALIAVVNPVESADAIYYIKRRNPQQKIILYEIDPASNRYKEPKSLFEKVWKFKSILWEKKIYEHCDKIIHMKTHRNHFSQNCFRKYQDKVIYLDIPNFRIDFLPTISKSYSKICMIYAGAFYPTLRNPYPMLDVLKKLNHIVPINVKIFTGSSMIEQIRKYVEDENSFLVSNYISQDALRVELCKADFLLDLGNKESDFLPSKTFQYMGTGKPIIHFMPDTSDVSVDYLRRYKDAISVFMDTSENNINSIVSFIQKERLSSSRCDSEELMQLFWENTPQYTAQKLMEILNC